jgi:ABC-type sugar transport system permease subunit
MEVSVARDSATAPALGRTVQRRSRRLGGRSLTAVAMVVPSTVFILLFAYYPAVRALAMSTTQWDGFNPPVFVGLQNFVQYLQNPNFGMEVRNVAIITLASLCIAFTLPLIAAEAVYNLRNPRAKAIYRNLIVLPMVVPFVVTIEIWSYIYNPQIGLLNGLLRAVGLSSLRNIWLSNPHIAIYCIVGVGFPWVAGLTFLIYLAGLQAIPHELLDAFALDSSRLLDRIRRLDLGMLRGQMRLVLVLTIIGALQGYVGILLLTDGGPGNATMVPGLDMYLSAFQEDAYGLGMAIATLLFICMLVLTLVVNRLTREE